MNKKIKILIIALVAILIIIFVAFLAYKIQHNYLVKILDRVKNINSIKYQFLMSAGTSPNETIVSAQNIYRKGTGNNEKARIENFSPSDTKTIRQISIMDAKNNLTYIYFLSRNTVAKGSGIVGYEGSSTEFLEESEKIKGSKSIIIGTDNLDGRECLVIKQLVEGDGVLEERFGVVKQWIWKDYGLSIKIEMSDGTMATRKNTEVNTDISDGLFLLPEGVVITSTN